MADTAFDLSAKLGFDTSKFQSSVNNTIQIVGKLQNALNQLGQSQEQNGLGKVLRLVVAIGQMANKTFGTDIPQAVGKSRMSLNELASALGAVKNQIKGVGTESIKAGQTFTASFKQAANAANQAAQASKRAGDGLREDMAAAARASHSTGREMVLVGRASEQMSNQIVNAAARASMAVAQMAMTVQRAKQIIQGTGGGGGGGGGGNFLPGPGGQLLLTGPGGGGGSGGSGFINLGAYGGALVPSRGGAIVPYRATGGFNPNITPASFASGMRQGPSIFSGFGGPMASMGGALAGLAGHANQSGGDMVARGLAAAYNAATQAVSAFGNASQRAMSVAAAGAHNVMNGVAALGAAMGLATVAGMKFGASYEQSMARVKAITQATDSEFAQLDKTAKQLGIDTVYSAKDAADGMAQMAQGGYKVNQIIGAMPSVMNLAAVAQVDVGQASRMLVNVMESMQLRIDQLPHSIDVLARALTMGGNDATEFAYAFKYIGPVAKAANVSLEEVAATIQLLGKQGIGGSMAGTSLRGIISHLASEGKNLKKQFDALGVAVYDSEGRLRRLPDIIDALNAGLAKTGRESESLKVVMQALEQRAGTSFQALLTLQGDAIRNATKQLEDSMGYAEKVAEVQQSTMGNRFKQVIESISTFGITLATHASKPLQEFFLKANNWLGEHKDLIESKLTGAWDKFIQVLGGARDAFTQVYRVASPVMEDLYNKAISLYQGFMQWFSSLPEGTQNALKVAAALVAIGGGLEKIGGMVPFVGQFAGAIGKLLNPLNAVQGAFALLMPVIGLGGSLAAAFISLAAAGGPIMLLIAALAGGAGLSNLYSAITTDSNAITSFANLLKGAFVDAFSAAKEAAAAFTSFLQGDTLESVGHVHKAIADLADAVGLNGLAGQLRELGDSEIVRGKGDKAQHASNVEKYGEHGANVLRARSEAQASAEAERSKLKTMKDSLIKGDVLGLNWAFGKVGLLPSSEDIAAQEARVKEANHRESLAAAAAMEFERNPAARFKAKEEDFEEKKRKGETAEQKRAEEIRQAQKAEEERKKNIGKDFFDMVEKAGKEQEKGRLEFDQQHASQVAQAQQQVAKAGGSTGQASAGSASGANRHRKATKEDQKVLDGLAAIGAATTHGKRTKEEIQSAVDSYKAGKAADLEDLNRKHLSQRIDSMDSSRRNQDNIEQSRSQQSQRVASAKKGSENARKLFARYNELRKKATSGKLSDSEMAELNEARLLISPASSASNATHERQSSFEPLNPRGEANLALFGNSLVPGAGRGDVKQAVNIFGGQRGEAMAGVQQVLGARRAGASRAELAQQGQAMGGLNQMAAHIFQQMQMVANLEGEEQRKQIEKVKQLQQAFFKLTDGIQKGTVKLNELTGAVKKTKEEMQKLAQEDADELAKKQGKLTPSQQMMQQGMQQFHQNVASMLQNSAQNAMQQAGQQAFASGQAMMEQAMSGPGQVQAMIDEAASTGHMKDAVGLIRQRLQAQLAQSQQNLHALAQSIDPGSAHSGVSNDAYLMSTDIPLARLIKFLEAQLNNLPKLASGGILTGPTNILAGEAGPEAVLPLNNFWNMMGSLPVFQNINNAMEKIGTWFEQGGTLGFGNMFGGNNPALAAQYFANLSGVQHTFEGVMDRLWNSRRVDFTPASMQHGGGGLSPFGFGLMSGARQAYGPGGMPFGVGGYAGPMFPAGTINLHFNGIDIAAPGAAVSFAQKLLPALDAEARRTGYSMMGNSVLRAGGPVVANRTMGYAR